MAETLMVDARGLSCPEPALMTKQAIRNKGNGTICVVVDNVASRDNVRRIAERNGWQVSISESTSEEYNLTLEK